MRAAALIAAAIVAVGCGGSGKRVEVLHVDDVVVDAAPRLVGDELTFWSGSGDDAFQLVGTYVAPTQPTEACVLFAHQLSSTRVEWAPVIERLRGRAHLFAIDLRGHGASTTTRAGTATWKGFTASSWAEVEVDLAAALDVLRDRGAGARCVVVGASIGSSATLRLAGAHPDRVSGVVLLSPGLNYRELSTPDAARATRSPTLIVHSQERGAVDAATALAEILRDGDVSVKVVADDGDAHGMKIVAGDPTMLAHVVGFISEHLTP